MSYIRYPNTGGTGLSVGTINGQTPSSDGAVITSNTLFLQTATSSNVGLLTAADWTTFNSKQSSLSFGNLTVPSILSISGGTSAVIGSGTSITLTNQSQNLVLASPNGSSGTPTFRALVGADLPAPSASTLGGVQSAAVVSHQWINSISVLGVPSLSQPAFSDISGSVAATQLPNPSASTLGGIQSAAAVSHQWIASISTSGVPALSQPAFSDVSGSVAASQMPALTGDVTTSAGAVATTIGANKVANSQLAQMAAHTYKGNNTGSTANAADITMTAPTLSIVTTSSHSGGASANGSGNYTTPANVLWFEVILAASGGGGSGGGAGGGAGTAGSTASFGTSLLSANGGSGGTVGGTANGGAGGSFSLGAAAGYGYSGGAGQAPGAQLGANGAGMPSGIGGANPLQGAGASVTGTTVGGAGIANSGAGGGGGGNGGTSGGNVGAGGGAGGYVSATIYPTPGQVFAYVVPSGGAGGTAGTSGGVGGAGGSGWLFIREHYQ